MKKIIISLLILITVGFSIAYFTGFKKAETKTEFKMAAVEKGELVYQVTTTGTLNALETVDIGSQTSGTIASLHADYNSIVKKGMLLAKIDPLTQKQAVFEAKAQYAKNLAQLEDYQLKLKKSKELYEKQLVSEDEFLSAKTTVAIAKATLDQSQSQLERAQINLSYTDIYAPSDGVVIDRKVNAGQTVNAGLSAPTLFTIAKDLGKMQLEALVDESDIGKIGIGQQAEFTVDAYANDQFEGKVSSVRLAPVEVSNVVNYTVVVDVDNSELKLLPGMTANVKIVVASRDEVTKIPNQALRYQPDKSLTDTVKVAELKKEMAERRAKRMSEQQEKGSEQKADVKAMQSPNKSVADNKLAKRAERHGKKGRKGQRMSEENGAVAATSTTQFIKTADQSQMSEGRFGRIWIKNKITGKLEPVAVRTGISDGKFTEIMTDKIAVGDSIVTGASGNGSEKESKSKSPLSGGMGGPRFH